MPTSHGARVQDKCKWGALELDLMLVPSCKDTGDGVVPWSDQGTWPRHLFFIMVGKSVARWWLARFRDPWQPAKKITLSW